MGKFRNWLKRATKWVIGHPQDPVELGLMGGLPSSSGEVVTASTALDSSGVAAIRKIVGETLASQPLQLMLEKKDGSREKIKKHKAIRLLREPAPYMTRFDLWEGVGGWFATDGIAFIHKVRNADLEVKQLAILDPNWVTPFLYEGTGKNAKALKGPTAEAKVAFQVQRGPDKIILLQDEVTWFKQGTRTGLDHTNPIQEGKESIGGALAADKYVNKYFANGAKGGLIFTFPQILPDDKYKIMRDSLLKAFGESDKAHKDKLLPNGVEAKRLSDNASEAQITEARTYNLMDIARRWRMQPNKLQEYGRATWKNVEEMGISFSKDVALPLSMRVEQALDLGFLTPEERKQGYYFKFNLDGLMRGDLKTRYDAYAVGRQWGWLSANDVLKKEDENGIGEKGDIYMVPSNMMDASKMDEAPEPGAALTDALDAFRGDVARRLVGAQCDMKPEKWKEYALRALIPFKTDSEGILSEYLAINDQNLDKEAEFMRLLTEKGAENG